MHSLRNELLNSDFANEFQAINSNHLDGLAHLRQAELHIVTARAIESGDYELILQTSYDAARKSLQAVLACIGLKVKSPPGNHWTFIKLSRNSIFESESWADLKWLRERRNDAEYFTIESPAISMNEAFQALEAACAMIADARRLVQGFH